MKFCFFGNISDALKGQTPGGGELQIALLAKALVQKGHDVVIIDPNANESFETLEGIKLINIPDWNKGMKGIRLFRHRIPALKKTLLKQNADYYYIRMRSYMHLIPYLVSKKIKRKFIVAAACDLDVLSFRTKYKYEYKPKFNLIQFLTLFLPNDIVYNYLLKRTDYLILQHSGQQEALEMVRGKVGIFPNIFDPKNLQNVQRHSGDYFIHVGALTALKGVENLYNLIKIIDKRIRVVVVGQPKDHKSKKIYEQLGKFENVTLKGRLDHSETIQLIAGAKALINISNYEGFPNIFLEAWATGVPVISLNVNPGDVINKYGLGIYCDSDLQKMKTCIESNELNMNKNKLMSYVAEFHDLNSAGDRFLNILSYS